MLLEITGGLLALLCALYWYYASPYSFWKNKNIPGPKPELFFGNARNIFTGKASVGEQLKRYYEEYKKEPMYGIYLGRKPVLVLHDSEMIKSVLIKDFPIFGDRGLRVNEKLNPLSTNLFVLERERWKPLRAKLTPIFTTGKLKEMCAMMVDCSEHLVSYMDQLIKKNDMIDVRDVAGRFTTDVIGCCAFGIDMKAMGEEDNEFRKMGIRMFNPGSIRIWRRRVEEVSPLLAYIVDYFFKDTELLDFFVNLTVDAMEYRKKNKVFRNDFIDVLVDLEADPEGIGKLVLTKEMLVSQAITFFAAGFETSSATISHGLYEMALNPEIQEKLRAEVNEYYKKHNGDLRYEHVREMKYLDQVFTEITRKYPAGTNLMRRSLEPYTFKERNLSLPAGQTILIPLYAFHHDADDFPDPQKFDPERFSGNASPTYRPMHFLPFGDGPRNCIGARFALYQTKLGLIKILQKFRVDICEKTMIPYEVDHRALVLTPKRGLVLKVSKVPADDSTT